MSDRLVLFRPSEEGDDRVLGEGCELVDNVLVTLCTFVEPGPPVVGLYGKTEAILSSLGPSPCQSSWYNSKICYSMDYRQGDLPSRETLVPKYGS